jgi:hypothetical protein
MLLLLLQKEEGGGSTEEEKREKRKLIISYFEQKFEQKSFHSIIITFHSTLKLSFKSLKCCVVQSKFVYLF